MSEIDQIISNAVQTAIVEKHEYVTLEHIMFSLLEDPSVVEILEKVRKKL